MKKLNITIIALGFALSFMSSVICGQSQAKKSEQIYPTDGRNFYVRIFSVKDIPKPGTAKAAPVLGSNAAATTSSVDDLFTDGKNNMDFADFIVKAAKIKNAGGIVKQLEGIVQTGYSMRMTQGTTAFVSNSGTSEEVLTDGIKSKIVVVPIENADGGYSSIQIDYDITSADRIAGSGVVDRQKVTGKAVVLPGKVSFLVATGKNIDVRRESSMIFITVEEIKDNNSSLPPSIK